MKKFMAFFMALSLVTALTAGCGSNQQAVTPASPANPSSPAEPAANTPAETPADTDTPSARTDLVIAINSDVSTMHPSDYSTSKESAVNRQIYDTLFRIDTGEFQPLLAERWEVSDDGMTYTFHLRKGVTFHNGTPFTADDVKFSVELNQASAYQGANSEGLESITVLDEHTIEMKTSTVFSPFLENISAIFIASKDYYDNSSAEDFSGKPVGTGAYVFVSHDLGSKITLKANPSYFNGEPAIKDIVFKVLADDATVAVSFQAGEIDFAEISETNYANLTGKEDITIQEVPMSRFGFISLNHERYPFSEVKFRQAVAYAIDRQNLIDLALDGIGTVNSNIISPLRFGWSADQPEYTYDPEKAKALLAELGIETPYDLGVMPVADAYKTQAEVIQNDLAAVGLNVQLEVLEFNALLGSMFNGDVGMTTMAMVLDGVTQQYAMALTTPYVGMANNVRYSNPEIDALFDKAVGALDENERFQIYNEIFTKVQEEAVFVVLYNTVGLVAHNSSLSIPVLAIECPYYIGDFSWK